MRKIKFSGTADVNEQSQRGRNFTPVKEKKEQEQQSEKEAVSHEKMKLSAKAVLSLVYQQFYSVCPVWDLP